MSKLTPSWSSKPNLPRKSIYCCRGFTAMRSLELLLLLDLQDSISKPTYHQDRHCHMDASAYLPKLLSGPRNGESQFSLVSAISTPTRSAPHGTLTAAALSSWSCRKRRITARRTRAKTSPAHETLTLQSRNHPEMSALFSAACLGLNVPIKRWRAGFSKHHPLPASGPTHFTQPTDKDSYAHTFVPESNKRAQ